MRFQITTLLLLTTIVALLLGWWMDWHRRQADLYLHVIRPSYYRDEELVGPESVVSVRVPVNERFHVAMTKYRTVEGEITSSPTGGYQAVVRGNLRSGFVYEGPVKFDSLEETQLTGFSGAVYDYLVVISRSKDHDAFLERQAQLDREKHARTAR